MTEQKFESKFHKWYVGGEGIVEETPLSDMRPSMEYQPISYDDILAEYRKYVGDPKAELPEEIMEDLRILGKV